MLDLFGDKTADSEGMALELARTKSVKYKIIHKYETDRGFAYVDANGNTPIFEHNSCGLYMISGPKILGPNQVDLDYIVPYYVGYAGTNNTIGTRVGRCIIEILDKSRDDEEHSGGKRIRNLLGKNVASLLYVSMMPFDVRRWKDFSFYSSINPRNLKNAERLAYESIENNLIRLYNPLFNKNR